MVGALSRNVNGNLERELQAEILSRPRVRNIIAL
jgi:hypothetical protein